MDAILQTKFSNAFLCVKIIIFLIESIGSDNEFAPEQASIHNLN